MSDLGHRNDESARLAERQRLLVATAEVQRLRLALQWRLLRHQTRPEALVMAGLATARQHSTWWMAAATLAMLALRRHRRHHADDDAAPLVGLFSLARWALRRCSRWFSV